MTENLKNIALINPPYDPDIREKKKWTFKGWSKGIRLFGLFFYISNQRMKKRPRRDLKYTRLTQDILISNKHKLYERQHHRCQFCGKELSEKEMELHHYLPVARFPDLVTKIKNGVIVCHKCHREIHINPYLNIKLMEEAAKEFDIDLREVYAFAGQNMPNCSPKTIVLPTKTTQIEEEKYEDRSIPRHAYEAAR